MTRLKIFIAFGALFSLWACGSPEQSTVDQFFRAARSNDATTLAYMAAVGPPGKVESWKVVEVTSRSTEPYTLPELAEKFAAAVKERDAALELRKKYVTDNQDALDQIIPKLRDDPEYKFRGNLAPIQEEWLRLAEDRKVKEGAYQELKASLDRETSLVSKSVVRQVDAAKLRGDVAVTEMLLNLKLADHGELPFKVKLRKYGLSEGETDRAEAARWIIVDIEGTTPEAKAAAEAQATPTFTTAGAVSSSAAEPAPRPVAAAESSRAPAAETKEPAEDVNYKPRELRGVAKVQTLAPESKVQGDEVISTLRVRNASKDWITGFMVTEHWYDKDGNAVGSNSRTHRERFMPGEVISVELRTRKGPNFYSNQYVFKHANGEVQAQSVGSFPKSSE
jgi:hypothetical protein